jgi:CP family cyanate transporter-like MFS transporter
VIGFCNAFLLILTLALPPLLSRPDDVHRLSAAMIAIGYLCAFVLPIVGGLAWDLGGSATLAWLPLIAFGVAALALAARLPFE